VATEKPPNAALKSVAIGPLRLKLLSLDIGTVANSVARHSKHTASKFNLMFGETESGTCGAFVKHYRNRG
jgi:hypothetical protein